MYVLRNVAPALCPGGQCPTDYGGYVCWTKGHIHASCMREDAGELHVLLQPDGQYLLRANGGPGWWVSFCRATSCGKWVKTGFTRDDAMTLRLDDPAGAKPSAPPSSLGEQGQTAASCAELGSAAPLELAFGEEASVAHDVQKLTMTQVGGGPVPPRQPNAHLHCSASQLLKPSLKFVPAPRAPAGVARQADAAPHIYGH